jgi:hypothetical protein
MKPIDARYADILRTPDLITRKDPKADKARWKRGGRTLSNTMRGKRGLALMKKLGF